jgi:hypothetical protein
MTPKQLADEVSKLRDHVRTMSASIDQLTAGQYLATSQWHALVEILDKHGVAGEELLGTIGALSRQKLHDYLAEIADESPAVAAHVRKQLEAVKALPEQP